MGYGKFTQCIFYDLAQRSYVLIFAVDVEALDQKAFNALVINYECSMSVVGIGFWRAPEILQHLKDEISGSKLTPKGLALFFMKTTKKTASFESKLKIRKKKVFRTILTIRSCR